MQFGEYADFVEHEPELKTIWPQSRVWQCVSWLLHSESDHGCGIDMFDIVELRKLFARKLR